MRERTRGRIRIRAWALLAVAALAACVSACVPPPGSPGDLARFEDRVVFAGLQQPTAFAFSPDGRVFVAEQSGLIKVFDDLDDTSATTFADLRTSVHNFWDRGLLGLALDPQFPTRPYVYVAYTYDAVIGGSAPRWGSVGTTSDPCPTPPGPTTHGCVVSGRLSRLTASGNTATSEQVLINDWCQQFPSHTVGTLAFGPDGALYVSGGEGASFAATADYGQFGNPANPCGDPPSEGGALRAQDVLTDDDPAGLDGAILRVDPDTGAAAAGNPMQGDADPNKRRIIAYGLRNPFQFTFRPGTQELWVGDVGSGFFEEFDRIVDVDDGVVENFGWPCYEGADRQARYDDVDLPLCEGLYASAGAATAPFHSYSHFFPIVTGCETGGGASLSGLAFYESGNYPAGYAGALFAADYSRHCIWMMLKGTNGLPDPSTRRLFAHASSPLSLRTGPGGDLYYLSYWDGTLHRFEYVDNRTPTAIIAADPTGGPSPLTVQFDGRGSVDPDANEMLTYQWDLDSDGAFDDGTGATATWTYATSGVYTPHLRVTDRLGATDAATTTITVDNSYPDVTIDAPSPQTAWAVGDTIAFAAHAVDGQDGPLPASALSWSLVLAHCSTDGCHDHSLESFPHTASDTFVTPDHEYPSHLKLTVTATDSAGLQAHATVVLQAQTVDIQVDTNLSGVSATVGDTADVTPFTRRLIKGSSTSISAEAAVVYEGVTYDFASWSDGGARVHTIEADQNRTYTATYERR